MTYSAYYFNPEGELQTDLIERDIKVAYESGQGLLWVDIVEPTSEDATLLEKVFGFHHLAIEDSISPEVQSSKIDDFDDYLFIIVHGINYTVISDIVATTKFAVFLGRNFVVTSHHVPLHSVDAIGRLVKENGRPMRRGADFLAHALIDALIDNVLPTIDIMGDVTDEVEDEVIHSPQHTTLEAILKLKRSSIRVHRAVAPQREIMNRLSRAESPIIRDEARIFYRDIYDHVVRIEDLNQGLRDRADNALATYLSSVANRQNEVMKVLSVVATIFLPLSLLAGIYGMNFENMPELKWQWAYFALLGFMGAVALGIITWFWGRRWFVWGRRRVSGVHLFAVDPRKLAGYLGHLPRIPHK